MSVSVSEVLTTIDTVAHIYFRLKHTRAWATFCVCEALLEAHRFYWRWKSIPTLVALTQSSNPICRSMGIGKLQYLSSRYTGSTSFSERAVKLGALPHIISCLSGSPDETKAALCVLSDICTHPLCGNALNLRVIEEIFELLANQDIQIRVRAAVLINRLASDEDAKIKIKAIALCNPSFIEKLSDRVSTPLPDRYQSMLDMPSDNMSAATLDKLKQYESQVLRACISLIQYFCEDNYLLESLKAEEISPVLIKHARGNDKELRSASIQILKAVLNGGIQPASTLSASIAKHWKEIMPKLCEVEVLRMIEEFGTCPEVLDVLIKDAYFLHRLPNLLSSKICCVRGAAFRALYPFTLSGINRWKIVRSGLLHLVFRGLSDRSRSVWVSGLLCLSQLSSSPEIFLAVKAEMRKQGRLRYPSKMAEYLAYLVLSFPTDDIGEGALRLLGESTLMRGGLPRRMFNNLRRIFSAGDYGQKIGTARLMTVLGGEERFRKGLIRSGLLSDLIALAGSCSGKCQAVVFEALATFSIDEKAAGQIASLRDLLKEICRREEKDEDGLVVAAKRLTRILSVNHPDWLRCVE